MATKKFNQREYIKQWNKKNMKQVKASYKTEFVDEFKKACKKLNVKQSELIRQMMIETIEKAKKL